MLKFVISMAKFLALMEMVGRKSARARQALPFDQLNHPRPVGHPLLIQEGDGGVVPDHKVSSQIEMNPHGFCYAVLQGGIINGT